jgi:hypothetical protein
MGITVKKKNRAKTEDDATDLALLLYDMYKAQKASGKIVSGQNNANDTKNQ